MRPLAQCGIAFLHRLGLVASIVAVSILLCAKPVAVAGAPSQGSVDLPGLFPGYTAQLDSQTVGDTVYEYYSLTFTTALGFTSHPIATHRPLTFCFYSSWHLLRINPVTHHRKYGVLVYDQCHNDRQVFPPPANPAEGPCRPDDNLQPSIQYSLCPTLPPGHVPAGLTPAECAAVARGYTTLDATVSPPVYDPSTATTLTTATSFRSDTTRSLEEGTCIANLSWDTVGWTTHWPDGAATTKGPSGQQGIVDAHTVAPRSSSSPGPTTASVTAVAHLHLRGIGLDFDANGNLVQVNREAFVDISNTGVVGALVPAVHIPPQLQLAVVAVGQLGDGTLPPPAPNASLVSHATTIRGRLLALYPRVLVVQPGTLSVEGVPVGTATTRLDSWMYAGGPTDAPPAEATIPGTTGPPSVPVLVQYNHAAHLDAQGNPIDEVVPLQVVATTTYPDGFTETDTVTGAIPVTIYYVGLAR